MLYLPGSLLVYLLIFCLCEESPLWCTIIRLDCRFPNSSPDWHRSPDVVILGSYAGQANMAHLHLSMSPQCTLLSSPDAAFVVFHLSSLISPHVSQGGFAVSRLPSVDFRPSLSSALRYFTSCCSLTSRVRLPPHALPCNSSSRSLSFVRRES